MRSAGCVVAHSELKCVVWSSREVYLTSLTFSDARVHSIALAGLAGGVEPSGILRTGHVNESAIAADVYQQTQRLIAAHCNAPPSPTNGRPCVFRAWGLPG